IVIGWLNRARTVTPILVDAVAVTNRVQGRPSILRQPVVAGASKPLASPAHIYPGDGILPDGASRGALESPDGSWVRIDAGTRVKFLRRDALEVVAGAVYVATTNKAVHFEIHTPLGTVRDVGTQFEVRLTKSSPLLRVRSGTVE